ncbi:pollen-specific leucine-rich repeat extensin-like protein 4 [Iris pallida]|uniref:Pollen-specific leucine-rich repeat extensin-like protein 4 n=1 Tax=Iris pallida TaxID=29817 RepID=A0AAX6GC67_IRIPA|nr:pollen-specific leucine-rich repeat extensin-like protein 4 [Iris pallida]KAJ6826162.1 pollen-specific leucine-rich repeat extensin-like protein 4 [Iris pallida]
MPLRRDRRIPHAPASRRLRSGESPSREPSPGRLRLWGAAFRDDASAVRRASPPGRATGTHSARPLTPHPASQYPRLSTAVRSSAQRHPRSPFFPALHRVSQSMRLAVASLALGDSGVFAGQKLEAS